MTTAHKGKEATPVASDLMLKKTNVRGSSVFTCQIYDIVQHAGDKGTTVAEIHDRLKHTLGFDADTALWLEGIGPRCSKPTSKTRSAGYERIRQRVMQMRGRGLLKSLDYGGTESRYIAGRAPKNWRLKRIPQANGGRYVDVDPAAEAAAARHHNRKIQWHKEMQTELAKTRTTKKLRELAEEALQLFYEGGRAAHDRIGLF